MSAPAKVSGALKSVDYEVFGRVQGVCFRMYTEQEAKKLGVVGWVKNTSQGTVTGQVQGPEERVNEMYRSKFALNRTYSHSSSSCAASDVFACVFADENSSRISNHSFLQTQKDSA
ncbi:acylphosphatase-2 isoform X1 [Serinus canaria]|uniref:acylphosphatase-2 isoform X1 n=1 Tax=Serinus canaria TaxID=9135 RepID=UPI0021CCB032|nr:acylphosphatase-2 isoform X1 [Serinus canaria]